MSEDQKKLIEVLKKRAEKKFEKYMNLYMNEYRNKNRDNGLILRYEECHNNYATIISFIQSFNIPDPDYDNDPDCKL